MPALPEITLAKVQEVLPSAVAFAVLGSIESLLSAVVADGMTGRRHRSNCELVAQGVANVASGLFGGICVTGNIRSEEHTSEIQSLMRLSSAVFCLTKKTTTTYILLTTRHN